MIVMNYRSKYSQTNLLMHQPCLLPLISKWPADPADRGSDKNMTANLAQISGEYVFRQELVKDSSFLLLQSSKTTGLSQFPTKTTSPTSPDDPIPVPQHGAYGGISTPCRRQRTSKLTTRKHK